MKLVATSVPWQQNCWLVLCTKGLLRSLLTLGCEHTVSRSLLIWNQLIFGHFREWTVHFLTKCYFLVLPNFFCIGCFNFPIISNIGKKPQNFWFSALWVLSRFADKLYFLSVPLELCSVQCISEGDVSTWSSQLIATAERFCKDLTCLNSFCLEKIIRWYWIAWVTYRNSNKYSSSQHKILLMLILCTTALPWVATHSCRLKVSVLQEDLRSNVKISPMA